MNCLGRVTLCIAITASLSCLFLFSSAYANHRSDNGLAGNIKFVREELPSPAPAFPTMTRETVYGVSGQVLRISSFVANTSYSDKSYSYDEAGRLILVSRQSGNRWLPETAYQYSADQLMLTLCYGPDGKLLETKRAPASDCQTAPVCKIERKGDIVYHYRANDATAQPSLSSSYEYANDTLFRKTLYHPNGVIAAAIIFDRQQNPITLYQYDLQGNLLTLEQTHYRVDEKGNWIEKTTNRFQNGQWQEPIAVKRTLSYY